VDVRQIHTQVEPIVAEKQKDTQVEQRVTY